METLPMPANEKPKESSDEMLAGCLMLLIGIPLSVLSRAWGGWLLWGWFALPLGAPEIGPATFYGLGLVLSMANPGPIMSNDKETGVSLLMYIVVWWLSVGFGYLAHLVATG